MNEYLYPSRDRVAELYLYALGSLFVTSYDSQGYGGGIRNSRYAGVMTNLFSRLNYCWPSPAQ
jgi:hypothetical protein